MEIKVEIEGRHYLFPKGITPLEIAKKVGYNLEKLVGAKEDGTIKDIREPLDKSCVLEFVSVDSPEAGTFIRHSAEHILADAVKRLWPDTQIDVGRKDHSKKFQYDFLIDHKFTPDDLEKIEKKMYEIIAEDHIFERVEMDRKQAEEVLRDRGEVLKIERLKDIPEGEKITFYKHGDFVDLCRGPHIFKTSQIGGIKLLDSSGVYYRGNENNPMLQRIYGTAFASDKELRDFLKYREEVKLRDHRVLGPKLKLFILNKYAPGSPFFLPKGAFVYNKLIEFLRELYVKYGYKEVITPQLFTSDLWKISGHYENYREAMFLLEVENNEYGLKPMNCPAHCLIFASELRSYRDLPVRFADFGRLHRNERSGVISGLTRVRSFAQDDAHIFCREDQIEEEVSNVINMVHEVYSTLGFKNIKVELSTRPEKFIGSIEMWDTAEKALKDALEKNEIEYEVNRGEGAFYGPKIDFQIEDVLEREWQLATIQLDYQLPRRFGLKYIDSGSKERVPVIIHRAILGSIERFFAVMLEQTNGVFPVWLSPIVAVVLPVSDKFNSYALEVFDKLRNYSVRAELWSGSEKLSYRIRKAQSEKIPYMVVIGKREQESGVLTVRLRTGENISTTFEDFANKVRYLSISRESKLW